jgi:DNA-binding TFAR19-related protein (PDSD5 family)
VRDLAAEEDEQNSRLRKQLAARQRAMQVEQQKREIAKRYMTAEAYERLMNVRISSHELYSQLMDIVIAMIQAKRITAKLTEPQLKEILTRLTYKPEPTIKFQHK